MSSRVRIDPSSRVPVGDDVGFGRVGGVADGGGVAEELDALRRAIAERPCRYVELSARTTFSFLSGAATPAALVHRAAELGYDAIGITDRDGLYGIVRAHEEAEKVGLRIIVGCELTLEEGELHPEGRSPSDVPGKPTTITVLVENHAGYINLCRLLTESHARHPRSRPSSRTENVDEDELPRNVSAGIPLARVLANADGLWALADATLPIGDLHRAFGPRLSIACHLHKDGEDRARVVRAEDAARRYGVPICATNRVLMVHPEDKPVLDVLHCIRERKTLDEAGRGLLPNAEGHLKGEEEITRLFSLHPAWVTRARVIADRCRFSIKELSYRFPYELTDLVHRDFQGAPNETANQALRRLTEEGARARYPRREGQGPSDDPVPPKVRAQIDKELALIERLEVAPYFLSVRAVVDMARRRDILCQGRGSAANSAVCFCLGITAVDPARSSLLFERFLSAERREPPDIDVDFEHERREEVIQEIYETYGRDRAAMVSEVICYRSKSALRDVGKAFGLSLEQVDRLAGLVAWWDGVSAVSESRLRAVGLSADDPRVRRTVEMARAIQGFPRHLSIHVGGFVLSARPLEEVAPVEPATMPGRTIVPWDKDDIDTLGFFKIDVLGLGILTAVRRCLDLVKARAEAEPSYAEPRLVRGTIADRLAAIPAEVPAVYESLARADTVGVFQIESRAQMAMLPRLKPETFYDLVIQVAIVRPGPIQGGMVHPYLRRRAGDEPSGAPHPSLEPILKRTLGVPLFQEQVMQIAIEGAGYSGGDADRLRRDMAAWRRTGSLKGHHERLMAGFRARGISREFGEQLFKQIEGFAEYGFPESHAASFALLVYATSWLKVFYPAEFAASLVNSQPMGFYSPWALVQDAQRHDVEVLPIDVATSGWDCACPPRASSPRTSRSRAPSAASDGSPGATGDRKVTSAIRLGLRLVSGLGEEAGRRVEAARAERPFEDVRDLAVRAELDRPKLMALAESGALDGMLGGRREALWEVIEPPPPALFDASSSTSAAPSRSAPSRRGTPTVTFAAMTRAEQLVLDLERTGLSVSDHPMKLLRGRLPKKTKSSKELARVRPGARVSVAGLVTCRQRPGTASGVVFLTLEDEHGFMNVVVWSRVFSRYREEVVGSRLLAISGKVERSDARLAEGAEIPSSVIHVVAEEVAPLDAMLPGVVSASRDFH